MIADWKACKKVDPSVVGKASKELERAKWKERKRKRKRRRISVTTNVIAKKKKLSAAGAFGGYFRRDILVDVTRGRPEGK